MKPFLLFLLLLAACKAVATDLFYSARFFAGQTALTNAVTLEPWPEDRTLLIFGTNFVAGPTYTFEPDDAGNFLITNVVPNDYRLRIAGITRTARISVYDTNTVVSMSSLISSGAGTYTYTNPANFKVGFSVSDTPAYLGQKLVAGSGIQFTTNAGASTTLTITSSSSAVTNTAGNGVAITTNSSSSWTFAVSSALSNLNAGVGTGLTNLLASAVTAAGTNFAARSSNLLDLASPAAARTNLGAISTNHLVAGSGMSISFSGLTATFSATGGTAAVTNTAGNGVAITTNSSSSWTFEVSSALSNLNAGVGTGLTNLLASAVTAAGTNFAARSSNLLDLASPAAARTNLGAISTNHLVAGSGMSISFSGLTATFSATGGTGGSNSFGAAETGYTNVVLFTSAARSNWFAGQGWPVVITSSLNAAYSNAASYGTPTALYIDRFAASNLTLSQWTISSNVHFIGLQPARTITNAYDIQTISSNGGTFHLVMRDLTIGTISCNGSNNSSGGHITLRGENVYVDEIYANGGNGGAGVDDTSAGGPGGGGGYVGVTGRVYVRQIYSQGGDGGAGGNNSGGVGFNGGQGGDGGTVDLGAMSRVRTIYTSGGTGGNAGSGDPTAGTGGDGGSGGLVRLGDCTAGYIGSMAGGGGSGDTSGSTGLNPGALTFVGGLIPPFTWEGQATPTGQTPGQIVQFQNDQTTYGRFGFYSDASGWVIIPHSNSGPSF